MGIRDEGVNLKTCRLCQMFLENACRERPPRMPAVSVPQEERGLELEQQEAGGRWWEYNRGAFASVF